MQSVNAQERPWKSSEVFDIKINSGSAQCTLQVSTPMPGTRKKRDRKKNPQLLSPFQTLLPVTFSGWSPNPCGALSSLPANCIRCHHPGTNSYRKLSPWSESPGGCEEGSIWLLDLFKMPGECFSPRAQPWLSVLSIPWRKVEKPAGAAFSLWFWRQTKI